MSAVSTVFMPASRAAWRMRVQSGPGVAAPAPNIIVPRDSGVTDSPVAPSGRVFITCCGPTGPLAPQCGGGRLAFGIDRAGRDRGEAEASLRARYEGPVLVHRPDGRRPFA